MMRLKIVALALLLSACSEVPPGTDMYAAQRSMPPDRHLDCGTLALVDEKCTRAWYGCKDEAKVGESCLAAYKTCCRLPGQGARSRIGGPEAVDE